MRDSHDSVTPGSKFTYISKKVTDRVFKERMYSLPTFLKSMFISACVSQSEQKCSRQTKFESCTVAESENVVSSVVSKS